MWDRVTEREEEGLAPGSSMVLTPATAFQNRGTLLSRMGPHGCGGLAEKGRAGRPEECS